MRDIFNLFKQNDTVEDFDAHQSQHRIAGKNPFLVLWRGEETGNH